MAILDLAAHPWTYVTVSELADYWRICREQVLAHLAAGDVAGIELGPGNYRIETRTAVEFERRSQYGAAPAAPAGKAKPRLARRSSAVRFPQPADPPVRRGD